MLTPTAEKQYRCTFFFFPNNEGEKTASLHRYQTSFTEERENNQKWNHVNDHLYKNIFCRRLVQQNHAYNTALLYMNNC